MKKPRSRSVPRGWQTFWRVTLPNIRWGLLYGVLLCNARAMGEFGAVSVVSGHIRGLTNTMPLHVEILYNEYNYTAAFAVASLLALLALLTLAGKSFLGMAATGAAACGRRSARSDAEDKYMSIALRGIGKQFGEFAAVKNIDLDVPTGALIALLGPSGCGKTTLLRIIAGLETPDEGQVLFDGRDATLWPIRDRKVGFVFQHYALFRHMSVYENVAFGLKVKPRRERPAARGDSQKGAVTARIGAARLGRRALPRAAVGRPEAAGCARTRAGGRPRRAAAG